MGRAAGPSRERTQRELLLGAMAEAAATTGYEASRVTDVVELSSLSRWTFYKHFDDKEECFLAAFEAAVEAILKRVEGAGEIRPADCRCERWAGVRGGEPVADIGSRFAVQKGALPNRLGHDGAGESSGREGRIGGAIRLKGEMALFRKPQRGWRYTRLMSETMDLTIVYEDGDDGWIVVSIPAVPGVLSQGRTREEARKNVLDALALMLSPEPVVAGDERERELLHLKVA